MAPEGTKLRETRLAEPMFVLVNKAAGSVGDPVSIEERLRAAFASYGLRVRCATLEPARLARSLRELVRQGAEAVAVAGGDGTLSTAVNALAETHTRLALLPLGTRNHLAQDLGIPLDLDEAVRIAASGVVGAIDVGEVNGHLFVNNASVGLYTRALRLRDLMLARLPISKRMASLYVMAAFVWRLPRYRLFLRVDDGDRMEVSVPFVFVGNNRYAERPLAPTSRERLDAGRLHLAYPGSGDFRGLLQLALGLLIKPLTNVPEFVTQDVSKLHLSSRRRRVSLALDGELRRIRQPLEFRIRSQALQVFLPAEPAPDTAGRSS